MFCVCVTLHAVNGPACVCESSFGGSARPPWPFIEIENVSLPDFNEPFYDSLSRR